MLTDKIKEISKTSICLAMNTKYANIVQLSGFIVQKPKIITGKRNKSCSFVIHQITNELEGTFAKPYSLITYVPNFVEELGNHDKVCLIHCAGVLAFNRVKKALYVHITDYKISYKLDMELEPYGNFNKQV